MAAPRRLADLVDAHDRPVLGAEAVLELVDRLHAEPRSAVQPGVREEHDAGEE